MYDLTLRSRADAAREALAALGLVDAQLVHDDRAARVVIALPALEQLVELAQRPVTVPGRDAALDEAAHDALREFDDDRATEECRECGGWTIGELLSVDLLCDRCQQIKQRETAA